MEARPAPRQRGCTPAACGAGRGDWDGFPFGMGIRGAGPGRQVTASPAAVHAVYCVCSARQRLGFGRCMQCTRQAAASCLFPLPIADELMPTLIHGGRNLAKLLGTWLALVSGTRARGQDSELPQQRNLVHPGCTYPSKSHHPESRLSPSHSTDSHPCHAPPS